MQRFPIVPGQLDDCLLNAMRLFSNDPALLPQLQKVFYVFFAQLLEELQVFLYADTELSGILEYIHAHVDGDRRVETLAQQAAMDRSYFSRKFKAIFHISPSRYILSPKMKVAARELTAGAAARTANNRSATPESEQLTSSHRSLFHCKDDFQCLAPANHFHALRRILRRHDVAVKPLRIDLAGADKTHNLIVRTMLMIYKYKYK